MGGGGAESCSAIKLGTLNRGQAAALAGLAPMNRDSGAGRGKRCIQAGRAKPRKALYMAAGEKYELPWTLLAGIGMAETAHGRVRATSSAGAQGLMQFMPATWASYGVDGDGDGRA